MSLEFYKDGARLGVPNARGFVPGSGDNPRAVRAERRGDDTIAMPLELEEDRACFRVQNSGCLVEGRHHDASAVGAERRGNFPIARYLERNDEAARRSVPDPGGSGLGADANS